jgi:hypothetical protein
MMARDSTCTKVRNSFVAVVLALMQHAVIGCVQHAPPRAVGSCVECPPTPMKLQPETAGAGQGEGVTED